MENVISAIKNKSNNVKITTNLGHYIIGLDSDFGLPYGVTELNGEIFKPIHYGDGLKIYKRLSKIMKGFEIKEQ